MRLLSRYVWKILTVSVLLSGLSGAAVAQDRGAEVDEAWALNEQAVALYDAGRYDEALPLAERALAIYEKALDKEHPYIAGVLNTVAEILREKGDYDRAEPLYVRALAIQEKALGPENPEVALTLSNLALLYIARSYYERAEPLLLRALAIWEKKLGPEHPDVAIALNNLALLYKEKGDYDRVEQLLLRAAAIWGNAYGAEHPMVANALNGLGWLYQEKGDYKRAVAFYLRALAIREKGLGAEHPHVAITLLNLAVLLREMRDYDRAERLFTRAAEISKKVFGPEHPVVASVLSELALVYQDKGDYDRAERLFRQAQEIVEKTHGPEHPEVAKAFNNLAILYQEKGDYAHAEQSFNRTLALAEKVLGAKHPHLSTVLDNLAALRQRTRDYRGAVQFLGRALEVREWNLTLMLTTGSENQKQLYLNTLSAETDATVSLHVRNAPAEPGAAQLAVTTILRRKGRALDAMTDQIAGLRRRAAPQDLALLDRLAAARSHLATLQLSERTNLSPAQRREQIARLEVEVESLEGGISQRNAEFRAQAQPVTLEAVRQSLPGDAVLVEMFAYHPFDPKGKNEAERYGARRYVAYVVRRDEAVPQWVELGEAALIDAEVEALRTGLKDPESADVHPAAQALYKSVMQPVRKLLGQAQRIFLSPDGALNLVPFAALVDEQGKYLVENYSLTYLTSGRDLLRMRTQDERRSASLIMADPLYDLAVEGPRRRGTQSSPQDGGGRRSADFTLRTYKPLPGTMEEAAALGKLWPDARVLTQGKATEAALREVSRPRFLHIATHGFFLADKPQELPAGHAPRRETLDTFGDSRLPAGWENPLLRSGLILAGVKQARSGAGQDGVLTALETAGLDLWGTKLVVLSACETGLGDVKNGAGVYGLRRTLVLAGSETQVMSLWKVSDAGTRDLMTAYYTRLQKGESRTEALREVQLEMLRRQLTPTVSVGKRQTSETGRKAATKDYRHPYYWAAFIPSGDWRSMDGK